MAPVRQAAPDERRLREERLLDAAARLLVRWGYRKTTIDDVAREAGVGKGTVYLHWNDKNELFRSAILRERRRYTEELERRIAADPEGGLLHRVAAHGMLATLDNPLMAAIIRGRSDIFNGFLGAQDPAFLEQIVGSADTYFVELQRAGLLRADVPAATITYLLTALKVGIINSPDIFSRERMPDMEHLTEALSDLVRRWLEPEGLPGDTGAGKRLLTDWVESTGGSE